MVPGKIDSQKPKLLSLNTGSEALRREPALWARIQHIRALDSKHSTSSPTLQPHAINWAASQLHGDPAWLRSASLCLEQRQEAERRPEDHQPACVRPLTSSSVKD